MVGWRIRRAFIILGFVGLAVFIFGIIVSDCAAIFVGGLMSLLFFERRLADLTDISDKEITIGIRGKTFSVRPSDIKYYAIDSRILRYSSYVKLYDGKSYIILSDRDGVRRLERWFEDKRIEGAARFVPFWW